jgi:acyl-CoA thioesterase I
MSVQVMRVRIRPRHIAVLVTLLGAVCLAVACVLVARYRYLERAELRLMPARSDVYLAENAALPSPVGERVVFFGDSRINGWAPRPQSGGKELVWRGVDGETTVRMVNRFQQDVIALQPTAVVIQAGINDLVAGCALGIGERSAANLVQNLRRMATMAAAASVDVYLLTILKPATPPLWRRPVWSNDIYVLVDSTNARIRSLAGKGVKIVEADSRLSGIAGRMPESLARDTLHLNHSGYEMLNGLIEDALGVRVSAVQ